ncbi:enoyl-CoA hydratase/isomerase family protein [Mycolicibacterium goodii]|uniref:enoyl-CoA hydratase/isomerase family protein n=1 Tax=Mycolicibacterium goodii TaxID=134601 RepID=UPI001BDD3C23|nr:enoyl-CoA hydratase/isomerase family protein [Mycolicibacterium goodii]MBU8830707.1 enoyl-CoA hydratase/isomerase family protein [Mycolicibacterium goodii]
MTNTREGSTAVMTLNRPGSLNAVNHALASAMFESLHALRLDPPSAVIIRGAGRAFCAGYDLKQAVTGGDSQTRAAQINLLQDVAGLQASLPFPVIAQVQGYAVGAGCELALGCDLIVASDDATFGFPEVSVGLAVTGGVTHLLPNRVGHARAAELLFLAQNFSAQEALEMGLINRVVPREQLEAATTDLATALAGMSATALAAAKQALRTAVSSSACLPLEAALAIACQESADSKEAAKNFQKSHGGTSA